jgi:uncharacterized protein YbgA (DUF1722 family)/uncharacterized protein YbbK (DUF523 family)
MTSGQPRRDTNVMLDAPLRVGVSGCLLGQAVRFDGGHKRDAFLVETLGQFVEFVAVCPEFELGLGVPRETLRLEREGGDLRLIAPGSGIDHTASMRAFAAQRSAALAREELSGYVLKSNSPSCGKERVNVHGAGRTPSREGSGLFAAALIRRYPYLPIEEESRLSDARVRENFIERIFAYHRLQHFFGQRWTHGRLIAFHNAHKLQLMAHSPRIYAELGRTVADARSRDRAELRETYAAAFMTALAKLATPARHANVLQHIAAYFRDLLEAGEREELAALIADYRNGRVPFIEPITLIRHYVRRFDIAYLRGQAYLEPQPRELTLRNQV